MNIGEQVFRLLKNSLTEGYRFAHRHLDGIQTLFIFIALSAAGFIIWQLYLKEEIVLLAGPKGGDGDHLADVLADSINQEANLLQNSYRIRKESTDGYEENRRRVEADSSGLLFAIAHDGFGESSKIRTLLPMNNGLLHVICRREFWDKCSEVSKQSSAGTTNPADKNRGFNVVASQISAKSHNENGSEWKALNLTRMPRLYLGPPDSGTRQMATIVADYYQLPYENYSPYGIANWIDMRQAFRSGDLDIAFYLGPANSEIIHKIAMDGKCCLLHLEEVEAIVQGHGQVTEATLKEHSYVPGEDFCPGEVSTLATRRVLICSSHMDTTTGFQLAARARDALRQFIPHLDWRATPPKEPVEPQLSYLLHPGAEYLSAGKTPGVMNWIREQVRTWWPFLASIGAAAVASILSWANTRMPSREIGALPSSEPTSTERSIGTAYEDLMAEIRNALQTLVGTDVKLGSDDYVDWEKRVAEFRDRIKSAHDESKIIAEEYETLLTGLRELRTELEFFHHKEKRRRTVSVA